MTNDSPFAQVLPTATINTEKPRTPWQVSFFEDPLTGRLCKPDPFENYVETKIKRRQAFPYSPSETWVAQDASFNTSNRANIIPQGKIYQL